MQINGVAGMITRAYLRQVDGASPETARHGDRGQSGRPRVDSVALSNTTRELMRVREVAAGQSDIRAERVAEIKAAIQSGEYKVDVRALAEKMLA